MKPTQIGDTRVDAIVESAGPYRSVLEMYPDATQEIVDRHLPWMAPESYDAENDQMILAFQSYLVRTPNHTILIDGCVGEDKERPLRPNWHRQKWPWMGNLRATSVAPEDIDFVMCTHLHVDHVGWNTQLKDGRWVPTFPNARYIFGKTEYDHWNAHYQTEDWLKDTFEDSVIPVMEAGQAELVDSGHEIESGLWLEEEPGHTPGSVCVHLNSKDNRAVFTGDMMHHAIQVPEPQLSSIFCWDPEQSRKTRTSFLDRHAETDTLLIPAHFPGRTTGHVVRDGDGLMYRFTE